MAVAENAWPGQRDATLGKGSQAFIEHLLGELEFVLAAPSRSFGIGAANDKVKRDEQDQHLCDFFRLP
jgi:hypothetical protein